MSFLLQFGRHGKSGAALKICHILVVDDDSALRRMAVDALSGEGYQIVEADCAERAMELARSHSFDTFLIDIDMAGISGIEICRELRKTETYKFTPIILSTSKG